MSEVTDLQIEPQRSRATGGEDHAFPTKRVNAQHLIVKSPKINIVSSVGPNDYSNHTWRLVNHYQIKYQKTELRRDTAAYI